MTIDAITSRQILDSRGRPTLETTVNLDIGISGTAAVPSGASTGSHEAMELRDGDADVFGGLGVTKAVANVIGPINKALRGRDVRDQRQLDQTLIDLDGTVNKSKLGANAILSVSLAASRAAAAMAKQPLYTWLATAFDFPEPSAKKMPRPLMNILNGGKHADTAMPVQEFMVIPDGPTVLTQIERGVAIYRQLATGLAAKHLRTTVGDEGGFAPALAEPAVALDFIMKAIAAAGLQAPEDVGLGLDIAATELFDERRQRYALGDTKGGLTVSGVLHVIAEWQKHFPIMLLEDALAEDDWAGWTALTKQCGSTTTIVGDDLFVTNASRLERGIEAKAANAVLIKPNQVGTLTETMTTIQTAQAASLSVVVSHRSGETSDSYIADLAVAVGAQYLKAGAPARGERVAKYNRLLAIAGELGQ